MCEKVSAITRFERRAGRSIQNLSLDRLTIDRTANYRDQMTTPAGTGQADHVTAGPRPEAEPDDAGQPSHPRARALLIIAALSLPLAGILTFLIAYQPFASAAGGCGGG